LSDLSLIIPCYNEAGNLPILFDRIRELRKSLPSAEVILVDNGSTDASPEIFRSLEAGPGLGDLKVLRIERNEGYGHGILTGLKEARGAFLAWTHADHQTDLADVGRALVAVRAAAAPEDTLVKGERKSRNPLDAFFTAGMSVLASLALGTVVRDVNAQPKLFSRKLYRRFDAPPRDFSLDLYLLYLARTQGFRIDTVPVHFAKRLHGEAKGGGSMKTKVKLTKRTFKYIFELRSRLRGRPA
jgi:glycosyltransferase involved in cell wall biosynthesis